MKSPRIVIEADGPTQASALSEGQATLPAAGQDAACRTPAMRPLPLSSDLLAIAPRIIWFEPPEKALADPIRFLAYLMTYGTPADVAVVRRYLDLDDFREALDHAPPGIIDERSWAYWNAMVGRAPPPMPRRVIPD